MSQLRLRMKVWTDPTTNKLYMVASGYIDTRKDCMVAYAMRDDDTRQLELTIAAWNKLSYKFFVVDGDAPRPEKKFQPDPVAGAGVIHP